MRHAPGSAILILLLIALPIAGLTGALAFWESHQPTRAQVVETELGRFDARIRVIGAPNPEQRQTVDSDWGMAVDSAKDTGPAPTKPPKLPTQAQTTAVTTGITPAVRTEGGLGTVRYTRGPVWTKQFTGVYIVISGRAPIAADEILASRSALERLGLSVGEKLRGADDDAPALTVVGTMTTRDQQDDWEMIYIPADSPLVGAADETLWYVAGWNPTIADLAEVNVQGYGVLGRELLLDPPRDARHANGGSDRVPAYATGAVIGTLVALLVGMIATAAMSVSARRQQRSLAMAASVGAGRGVLFGIVLGQAVTIGVLAAVVGIGAGLGAAALALALLDRGGSPNEVHGSWGFHVPLLPLIGIAVFAVVIATVVAIGPARAATRGDTLAALRGARRPVRLSVAAPRWGLAILIVGLGATISAVVFLGVTRDREASPLFLAAGALAVAGGVVVTVIGLMLIGHRLLVALAAASSAAGASVRLATRDTAAAPSRSVPAVLATAMSVLVAVTALGITATSMGSSERGYYWEAPANSLVFAAQGDSPEARDQAAEHIAASAASAPHRAVGTIGHPAVLQYDWENGGAADPDQVVGGTGWFDARCTVASCVQGWAMTAAPPAIIRADDLATTTGITLSPAERQAYEDGAAIVRWPGQIQDGKTRIFAVTAGAMADVVPGTTPADLSASSLTPAILRADAHTSETLIIAPATADRLRLPVVNDRIIVSLPDDITQSRIDKVMNDMWDSAPENTSSWVTRQDAPQPAPPWLAIITAVAALVVIGTASVSLGLGRIERRPDDATLTAVGATARVRRNVNAVQALVVVGTGAALGGALGVLVTTGFVFMIDDMRLIDIPWPWIAGVVVALPLAIAATAWLVPPRSADLTHRTAIT